MSSRWTEKSLILIIITLSILFLAGCSTTGIFDKTKTTQPGTTPETVTVPESEKPQPTIPAQGTEAEVTDSQNSANSQETNAENSTEIAPNPPGTPIHPFYEVSGEAPTAPGLAMRTRIFTPEPEKIVYLTIDDGPAPETTPQILKILQDEGVKATFFVMGTQVQKYPDLLKAEFSQGHSIGNHTYSHDYTDIYRSPEALLASIKKNEDLIYNLIGMRPQIFRTPGGTQTHFGISYFNALDRAGYLVFDWNVSTSDTAAPLVPADTLVKNVVEQSAGKNRMIILMHDAGGKVTTVEALPRIIQYLKSQGFTFGVLNQHIRPILFPGGFNH